MIRSDLYRAVDLAHGIAHSATLAASYDGIDKARAEHFARLAEEGAYAVIEALFEARLSQPSAAPVHPIMADILASFVPQPRKAA